MRETEILVEQQPPQGVLVCDHAGLVINKFSELSRAERRSRAVVFLEREFFIDNLLVRIHLIIEMISVDLPCAIGV